MPQARDPRWTRDLRRYRDRQWYRDRLPDPDPLPDGCPRSSRCPTKGSTRMPTGPGPVPGPRSARNRRSIWAHRWIWGRRRIWAHGWSQEHRCRDPGAQPHHGLRRRHPFLGPEPGHDHPAPRNARSTRHPPAPANPVLPSLWQRHHRRGTGLRPDARLPSPDEDRPSVALRPCREPSPRTVRDHRPSARCPPGSVAASPSTASPARRSVATLHRRHRAGPHVQDRGRQLDGCRNPRPSSGRRRRPCSGRGHRPRNGSARRTCPVPRKCWAHAHDHPNPASDREHLALRLHPDGPRRSHRSRAGTRLAPDRRCGRAPHVPLRNRPRRVRWTSTLPGLARTPVRQDHVRTPARQDHVRTPAR